MCSTTPKTKAASPGVKIPSKIQKPVPGGGAGSTVPPIKFKGAPEHIPDLTFIVEPRVTPDDYLNAATIYHTNCGLQPRQIHSIDHMLDLLSADTTQLKRIRLVSHASGEDILVPIFGQTNVRNDRHAFKIHLNAFAESDELGLLTVLDLSLGQDFHGWSMPGIMSMIRNSNPALLAPFDMQAHGIPPRDLERFVSYCCDKSFVAINFYKKNNGNLSGAEKTGLLKAMDALIDIKGKLVEGTKFGTHTVTANDLLQLRNFLTSRNANDLGLAATDLYNYQFDPNNLNIWLLAGAAADSIQNNTNPFRAKLNKVRARFNKQSVIDIRGCRAGVDLDYLRAVQAFMGQPNNMPQVSGPLWYQAFAAANNFHHPANNAAIHTLLQNGTAAAAIRNGFATWLDMTGMTPAHQKSWSDVLTGSAVKFCALDWRNSLPALPLKTPGLTAFNTMNFINAINAVRDFFNVPAGATPSGSTLTTINDFVTNTLTGYKANLLATVDGTTSASTLTNLYTALKQINQDLGQSLVPPTPPNPLKPADIISYQTALINFIDTNKLAAIRTFMTAAKQRIDDANDPGLFYYALQTGIPVFIFSDHETVNDHMVAVNNNRLVVHDLFADDAYRQWPPLLWAEPLPSSNTISTLHPNNADARRFAMMVELPTGGNSHVGACPHPDYMNHIVSV